MNLNTYFDKLFAELGRHEDHILTVFFTNEHEDGSPLTVVLYCQHCEAIVISIERFAEDRNQFESVDIPRIQEDLDWFLPPDQQ